MATKTAGMNDSSGGPAMTYTFAEGPSQADAGGGDSTVFRAISVGGAWYDYFYDAKMRRRLKQYPSGISDEYFYDVNDELIVDQGNATFDPAGDSYHTEDDYVWLGGRPVLIFRGKLFPGGDRYDDSSTACSRLGETTSAQSVACGAYFPITDYLGRPVAMYDSSQRLTGVGEYQPFGQVNRVSLDKETAHPYSGSQTDFADFVPATIAGLTNDLRVKFQAVDTLSGQCGAGDFVAIIDKGTAGTLTTVRGSHAGTAWSGWLTPSNSGAQANLVTGGAGHNCNCFIFQGRTQCTCCLGNSNTSNIGAIVESYQYRRYQSGATPFWTPLRFPGQYHDEETDLNQNWNRFYEPASGGYLEPEPILVDASEVMFQAAYDDPSGEFTGVWPAAYAYARNNPFGFEDVTGKVVRQGKRPDGNGRGDDGILHNLEHGIVDKCQKKCEEDYKDNIKRCTDGSQPRCRLPTLPPNPSPADLKKWDEDAARAVAMQQRCIADQKCDYDQCLLSCRDTGADTNNLSIYKPCTDH